MIQFSSFGLDENTSVSKVAHKLKMLAVLNFKFKWNVDPLRFKKGHKNIDFGDNSTSKATDV